MQLRKRTPQIRDVRGFTLTELAVVFAIVALLIGGAMMTLSAQIESRDREETRRRLDAAVDAILGFAVVNRRLPCPAVPGATGDESLATGTTATGGQCTTTNYDGFLPARSIGFQPVDGQGYGLDAWGNRIRYVVAATLDATAANCTAPTLPHFTSVANLKANGIACRPGDIDLCTTATGTTAVSCNTATRVVSSNTVAMIIFSTGKNGSIPTGQGADEVANTDANRVFVSRLPGTVETGGAPTMTSWHG